MTTSQKEYFANLDILQNINQPAYALLPKAGTPYHINVETREIATNSVVLLEKDHKSTTIYFSIDRYVDYMDLAQTVCVIQYNANGRTRFYPVPFYDVYSKNAEKQIIFPWNLDYAVTENPGTVPFCIRFFKIGTQINDKNEAELILTYNLNTSPSALIVKKSLTEMQIDKNDKTYLQPSDKDILMSYIDEKMKTLSRKLYWTVLTDEFSDSIIDIITEEVKEDLLNTMNPPKIEN